MSDDTNRKLDYRAARAGVEWATKVRATFRVLGATIPPSWPGTRAGARSLVDQICDTEASTEVVERLTSIVEERAERAWDRIRRWSGEHSPTETSEDEEG